MSDTPPDPPPSSKPTRRPRYPGRNPRRFDEKYKEHNPERYSADVAKVIASGKTPAGTHRSIMVREVLEVLAPKPGETAVDATLGYGGHASALFEAIRPGGRLLGLDVDPIELPKTEARLRASGLAEGALIIRRSNFAGLPQALAAEGLEGADVILADLGLSSMQLADPARGFTFKEDGPLDLRMNPERGQPASAFLAHLTESQLAAVLSENADEPDAVAMARAIMSAQAGRPITTTTALAEVVRETVARTHGPRSRDETNAAVRRVFQALRIAVNDEFGALDMFLRHLPECLKRGGRVAVLTFHSGEDRRVKKAFQAGQRSGHYARISSEVIRAGADELRANPRSSSAKLRWAVRGTAGQGTD
jgi:16S rRNA (cytosine1402-N4)-methyltransferase